MQTLTDPRIKDYELQEQLGSDDSAYLARRSVDSASDAAETRLFVKLLDRLKDPVLPRRFVRSRRTLDGLIADGHRIVPLLDHGTARSGHDFVVTPFYANGSLADLLRSGPLEAQHAIELVADVADIVQEAHVLGLSFGDIRPSAVLLDDDMQPILSVYGSATRRFDDGTPTFRAPELDGDQVRAVTPVADVYSLSALLAALLSGRPKERSESIEDYIRHLLSLGCPTEVADAIEQGMSDLKSRRFRDASAFRRAITRTADDELADDEFDVPPDPPSAYNLSPADISSPSRLDPFEPEAVDVDIEPEDVEISDATEHVLIDTSDEPTDDDSGEDAAPLMGVTAQDALVTVELNEATLAEAAKLRARTNGSSGEISDPDDGVALDEAVLPDSEPFESESAPISNALDDDTSAHQKPDWFEEDETLIFTKTIEIDLATIGEAQALPSPTPIPMPAPEPVASIADSYEEAAIGSGPLGDLELLLRDAEQESLTSDLTSEPSTSVSDNQPVGRHVQSPNVDEPNGSGPHSGAVDGGEIHGGEIGADESNGARPTDEGSNGAEPSTNGNRGREGVSFDRAASVDTGFRRPEPQSIDEIPITRQRSYVGQDVGWGTKLEAMWIRNRRSLASFMAVLVVIGVAVLSMLLAAQEFQASSSAVKPTDGTVPTTIVAGGQIVSKTEVPYFVDAPQTHTTTTRPPTTRRAPSTTVAPTTVTTTAKKTTTARKATTTVKPATTQRSTTTAKPATTRRSTTTAKPATTRRKQTTTKKPPTTARPTTASTTATTRRTATTRAQNTTEAPTTTRATTTQKPTTTEAEDTTTTRRRRGGNDD